MVDIPSFPKLPEVPGLPSFSGVEDIVPDCKTQKVMCDKLKKELDGALNEINSAKKAIANKIKKTLGPLSDYSSQAVNDLTSALDALNSDSAVAIPAVDECSADELKKMMQSCGLAAPAFDAPKNMEKEFLKQIQDKLKEVFGDFELPDFSGINFPDFPKLPSFDLPQYQLPEFSLSLKLDAFDSFLDKFKFPDLLGKLDGLFTCLDSICKDYDIDDKITGVNGVLSELGINDQGKLDMDKFFDDAGLSSAHRGALSQAKDGMASIKSSMIKAAEDSAKKATSKSSSIKNPVDSAVSKFKALF